MPIDPTIIKTLESSTDGAELGRALQSLAGGTTQDEHTQLVRFLSDPAFLTKLDNPATPPRTRHHANFWRPIRTLMESQAPIATGTISSLCGSAAILTDPTRVDLLIDASENVRPATPTVVAMWDRFAKPGNQHLTLIAKVCPANGSEPAMEFFGRLYADTTIPATERRSYMRDFLLPYRTGDAHIRFADTTARRQTLPIDQRVDVVEAMFDYRPTEWYRPHSLKNKPKWVTTTMPGRVQLRALAAYAKDTLSPPAQLRASIDATLVELDAIDQAAGKQTK